MQLPSYLSSRVVARPVLAFYLLAFGITWAAWLPQALHARGWFPFDSPVLYVVGGLGPGVAAWAVVRIVHGKEGEKAFFAQLLRRAAGARWYALALVLPVAMTLAAAALAGELDAVRIGAWATLLVTFGTRLVAAIPEEVGWRGFALPRLQDRYGPLLASLVVGVLWALWHLPLLWNPDDPMSSYPPLLWFAGTVLVSVVYTWAYRGSGGVVLVVVLLHAVANTAGGLLEGYLATETLVIAIVAVVVVLAFFPRRSVSSHGTGPEGSDRSPASLGKRSAARSR